MRFRHFLSVPLLAAWLSPASQAANLDSVRQLLDQHQYTEALSLTVKAIETDPLDMEARLLQGVALAQSGRLAQAEMLFKSLLNDEAGTPQVYNNLAAIYASQERFEQARMTLMTAIEHDPAYTMARENLGDLYTTMASIEYRQALNSAPDNQRISHKLRSLAAHPSASGPHTATLKDPAPLLRGKRPNAAQSPAEIAAAMTVPQPPALPASRLPVAPVTAPRPESPVKPPAASPTTPPARSVVAARPATTRPAKPYSTATPRPLDPPSPRSADSVTPKPVAPSGAPAGVLELIVTPKADQSGSRKITIKPTSRRRR